MSKTDELLYSLTREMDSSKRYMEMQLENPSRCDYNQVQNYLTKIQNGLAGLNAQVDKLGSAGKDASRKWTEYLDSQTKKIENIKAEEALKEITTALDRIKHWLDGYLKEGKVYDSEKYFTQLTDKLKEKEGDLSKSDAGKAYLAKIHGYMSECQVTMAQNKLKETASNIIQQTESQMRWMNNFKERGETDRVAEYWKKIQDLMAPILADNAYQQLSNVKDIMVKYRDIEQALGGDLDKIKRKQALEAAENQLKSKGRWLTNSLNDKNLDYCSKYSEEFRPMFDSFENEFGGEPAAKDTINWGRELLGRVTNEMGPMINKMEADKILSPGRFNVRWLTNALNDKDQNRAIEYRDKLQPNIDALRDPRYVVIPDVADFLKEADEAMERMDNELGNIIAGKEIAAFGEQARGQLRYLEDSLNRKDTDSIQNYVEKVQKIQASLQRYGKYSDAQQWLSQISQLLTRVDDEMGDIIANNKIIAISKDLDWPLKNLERSIQNREVTGIIQGKERVLELSAALVPFSSYSAAKPTLDHVNHLLSLCDGEVATIIVDSKITEIQNSFHSLIAIVKQANASGDARVVAATSLKLSTLIYPLRVQYGRFPKVQEIVRQVDEIIYHHQIKMNDYQKQKFDSLKGSLSAQVSSLSRLSGGQLANTLKEVNKQVQLIRKQSLNDPVVLAYLLEIDLFNLKVFGRIPSEDEFMPILELDMKAPFAVQNAVKACNKVAEEINTSLVDCKNSFGKVDITGATVKYDGKFIDWWTETLSWGDKATIQMKVEASERAIKAFQEKQIDELRKLDPSCPALSIYPDAIEQTTKTIQKWKKEWPAAIHYSNANARAYCWLNNLKTLIAELGKIKHDIASTRHWYFTPTNLFGHELGRDFWAGGEQPQLNKAFVDGIKLADNGLKQVATCYTLREDHPESSLIGAQLEKLRKEIYASGVTMYETLIKLELDEGKKEHEYEYENLDALKFAQSWVSALKELSPDHPGIAGYLKAIEDTKTWLSQAKQRKEEAARLKREEAAAATAKANQLLNQKWKTPYSGGIITCYHSVWEYTNEGNLRFIQGDQLFNGWTATWGITTRDRVSLDLVFHASPSHPEDIPQNFCWLLWENGAMECDFHTVAISNMTRVHSVISVPAPGPAGYFHPTFDIKQTTVEGSVPPPLVAAITGLKLGLKECQDQLKVDRLSLRKVKWKEQRYEELSRNWPSTCRNCNTSGSNQYFCFDCEKSYCVDSRCKASSSGPNVCPFCNSYSGGYRPSWASALKDPRDNYNWERSLNEFILKDSDYPRWARWLESLRF